MKQDTRRKQYIERYREIYETALDFNQSKAEDIIGRLADVCVCLDECIEHLSKEGLVVSMCQGNYSIDRENPYSKIYNDKQKLYNSLIKMLDDMMPTEKQEAQAKAGEALKAFITAGRPKGYETA